MAIISIIVPTMNRANSLRLAIESFCQQNFPTDQYEILVVDNGSTDNTKEVVKTLHLAYSSHLIKYIFEPEPGLLSGRHRGAFEAKGELLTFVDDDIEADSNWLWAINESFKDPTVQLVGGRNLPKYECEPPAWLEWFWWDHPFGKYCPYLSLLDFGDQIQQIDANYVWGLNFSIRKKALFELGGFHPDCIPKHLQHFQGDGETGLTQKANAKTLKAIYQPKSLVYHTVPKARMTYNYFDKRFFYHGVCDSYTNIRREKFIPKTIGVVEQTKVLLRFLKNKYLIFFSRFYETKQREMLYYRFHQAYQKGYRFHQNSVRKHPKLLSWILKEDYWVYKIPNL